MDEKELRELIREIVREEIENSLTLEENSYIDYGKQSKEVALCFNGTSLGVVTINED